MKKLLLASVAGVALIAAGSANAADLGRPVYKAPPPVAAPVPVFSWTGCYIGAHVGWGWGKKDNSNSHFDGDSEPTVFLTGSIDTSGGIFGGQVGCDYQFGLGKGGGLGAWVIGVQGSVSGADINGIANDVEGDFLHVKTDFLASVTGRLGWSGWDPRVLFYVKGGGAWAHDNYQFSYYFGKQSRSGWTVGTGIEWAFAPNWSAFVEWDHYDFGTKHVRVFSATEFDDLDVKQRIETVKVGVNYRFSWFLGKGKAPIAARY